MTTAKQIERIIREELEKLVELNPWHSSTGKFAKKGTELTYSLSKRATGDHGINPKYALKGEKTSDYDTDNPSSSITTKAGSDKGPKTAGRQDIDGKKVPITYSLSDYDKRYTALREFLEGMTRVNEEEEHRAVPASILDQIITQITPYLDGASFPAEPPAPERKPGNSSS